MDGERGAVTVVTELCSTFDFASRLTPGTWRSSSHSKEGVVSS